MKISLNDIKFYQRMYQWSDDPAPHGLAALVDKIGAQLGAVEEVTPVGERYEGAVIVRVVDCQQHPDADRLRVCKIDDNGHVQNVERDDNGHVQVVCGAPNVQSGMLAVWLPPGATVPSTYYDIDRFILEARALRGQISNGMLASAKELAISDEHDGILDITEENSTPGTPFVDAFNLRDDHVIDLENKMFTHRPDCFGIMGIAREIAGIQGQQFTSPNWYRHGAVIDSPQNSSLRLEVRNELPQLVPRFTAITMSNVTVKPSPVWLQLSLAKVGIRPINNIVDVTNYFMLLTGQPLHAYDYDKVVAQDPGATHATLVIRKPYQDEKINLLNGKEVVCNKDAIVIATNNHAIGLGGVMGGASTQVDTATKNIILESATFDMYATRRTSMALGLFTDAVTRYTKGQSPLQNAAVLARAIKEIEHLAGGALASALADDNHLPQSVQTQGSLHRSIEIGREFIIDRLGIDISTRDIARLLSNVEFGVTHQADTLTVTAPFWRTDITIPEDIVEEIGRLYGYDKLPITLPRRSLAAAPKNHMLELQKQIRGHLSAAGANEVLSYNFVHANLIKKVGQDVTSTFQIANALSPDLHYYRLSLTPSLLDKIHPNIKAGHDQFALFEMGKAHIKDNLDEENLPKEFARLAFVFAADKKAASNFAGAPYYQARTYLIDTLVSLHLARNVTFEPLQENETDIATTYYEPGRSATVLLDGKPIGYIGEYKASVRRALKLPDFIAGFELSLTSLVAARVQQKYIALPRFPKVEQDICLRVPANVSYGELFQFVWQHSELHRPDHTFHTLGPIDIYQRPDDTGHKQITFRLTIASYERTLTDQEVNDLLDKIATTAKETLGAERI